MRLFDSPTVRRVKADVQTILHLPLVERLLHSKARRPLGVLALGIVLMVLGSMIAAHRHELAEWIPIHHLLFDTGGYFLHAVGAVPALRYVEPVWAILAGAAAE